MPASGQNEDYLDYNYVAWEEVCKISRVASYDAGRSPMLEVYFSIVMVQYRLSNW